jgi:hypothetical protein
MVKAEIRQFGAQKDIDNMIYILEGKGQREASLPPHVKDFIAKGQYHGGSLERDDFDKNNRDKTFADFCNHEHAKLAKLKDVQVFCLRFYTTDSFSLINKPLRERKIPHPLAVTTYFLTDAIKKLRSVQAKLDPEGFRSEMMLFRGMKDTTVALQEFEKKGGTELAVMSTSASQEIAIKYAESKSPLIFEYVTTGMTRGVSLEAFSVFPLEKERVYPPGTYLQPVEHREEGGCTIIRVQPHMA